MNNIFKKLNSVTDYFKGNWQSVNVLLDKVCKRIAMSRFVCAFQEYQCTKHLWLPYCTYYCCTNVVFYLLSTPAMVKLVHYGVLIYVLHLVSLLTKKNCLRVHFFILEAFRFAMCKTHRNQSKYRKIRLMETLPVSML